MIIRAFSAALLIAVSAQAQAEQPPVNTLTNSVFCKTYRHRHQRVRQCGVLHREQTGEGPGCIDL